MHINFPLPALSYKHPPHTHTLNSVFLLHTYVYLQETHMQSGMKDIKTLCFHSDSEQCTLPVDMHCGGVEPRRLGF